MTERDRGRLNRRNVIKGLGIGAVGVGGATGLASAHHVQELRGLEDVPSTVIVGEPFSFTVLWTSGHGGQACFVAAIDDGSGNWTKIGQATDSASSVGQDKETQLNATVPSGTEAGSYTLRVSATEEESCPQAGDTREDVFYVRATDTNIEVKPPVEVADVSFRGCSEVWVAFDEFPVSSTGAEVNIDGNWQSTTISQGDLTKIPGQYGDKPVYKHSVSNGSKLVGLKIVGETHENTNNCAKNV